jgi:hypothetical protein
MDRRRAVNGPFVVGQDSFLMVGIGGEVTALGEDWVEIAGHRLPTHIVTGTVRYLSLDLPTEHDGDCDELTENLREAQDEVERIEERWSRLVQEEHRDEHAAPWVLCTNRLCMSLKKDLRVIGASA